MAEQLQGRTALITGASSGIGRATALALGRAGMRLALVARSADRLRALADEIAAAGGPSAAVLPADLAAPGAVEAAVAAAEAALGRIDVLFANAGIYRPGPVATGDPDDWDRMLMLNTNSVLRAVRAVLPGMQARRTGDILVTNSISGYQAFAEEPAYCASKHALTGFLHGLRRQVLADGIRVGSIAPGTVANELWGVTDPAETAARVAARQGLSSEDIAEIVVFWLTRPRHVTLRDIIVLPQAEDL